MLGSTLRALVQAPRAYCCAITDSRLRRINVTRLLSTRAKRIAYLSCDLLAAQKGRVRP